jgi:N-acetylglucosamine-6-phosphate deacetylase
MRVLIKGGKVITPLDILEEADVLTEDGRIFAVGPGLAQVGADETIDATGRIVAPGYVDIHIHGSAGHDTMDGTREAIEGISRFLVTRGVTSFCPTTLSQPTEDIMRSVRAVYDCIENPIEGGAQPLGVHLEGPCIDIKKKGAQPEQHIRAAADVDYEELFGLGNIKLITLAPEIAGNRDLIAFARSQGATVVVGHSSASYEDLVEATKLGVNHATHTFNQMEGLHHRKPGTVGGVLLLDEIYAEFIADGIHLHPAIVDMIVRLKGPDKAVAITDAISGAGMPDGDYELGGQRVIVKEGAVRLADGTLAGSALTLDAAVRNILKFTRASVAEAIQMATLTPARSIGVSDRKGSLEPGREADLVMLDQGLNVVSTMVMGEVVHRA